MTTPTSHVLRGIDRARSLRATGGWLARAVEHGAGGVSRRWRVASGWSGPCAGATGAVLAAFAPLDERLPELGLRARGAALGRWLLGVQRQDGAWSAGEPGRRGAGRGSLLETACAVRGLLALQRSGVPGAWSVGVERALGWSRTALSESSLPGCATEALADLIAAARAHDERELLADARAALERILERRDARGDFAPWEAGDRRGSGTRAIAAALLGLLRCARELRDAGTLVAAARGPLERLARMAEGAQGRLPAAFDARWEALDPKVDPGANAKLALALLELSEHAPDAGLEHVADLLVDVVCAAQVSRHPLAGARGAVGDRLGLLGQAFAPSGGTLAAADHTAALLGLLARAEARPQSGWGKAAA